MSWIDKDYPNTAYIAVVKYQSATNPYGDASVSMVRCNNLPKDRDNKNGFTKSFWDEKEATRYAKVCANELEIKAIV